MRRTTLCLAGCLLLLPYLSQGQSLSLGQLLALSASAGDRQAPEVVQNLPGDKWIYQGLWQNTNELYWTSSDADEPADSAAEPLAYLGLRPGSFSVDVVYKTVLPEAVGTLRSELRRRKMVSEPVTCLACEGVRYSTPEFQLSIYSKRKGEYPFVVVVHRLMPTPSKSSLQAKALLRTDTSTTKATP